MIHDVQSRRSPIMANSNIRSLAAVGQRLMRGVSSFDPTEPKKRAIGASRSDMIG